MKHHTKEPTHRVYWECLGATCDLLFDRWSQARKMRDWLLKWGRVAWTVAL